MTGKLKIQPPHLSPKLHFNIRPLLDLKYIIRDLIFFPISAYKSMEKVINNIPAFFKNLTEKWKRHK